MSRIALFFLAVLVLASCSEDGNLSGNSPLEKKKVYIRVSTTPVYADSLVEFSISGDVAFGSEAKITWYITTTDSSYVIADSVVAMKFIRPEKVNVSVLVHKGIGIDTIAYSDTTISILPFPVSIQDLKKFTTIAVTYLSDDSIHYTNSWGADTSFVSEIEWSEYIKSTWTSGYTVSPTIPITSFKGDTSFFATEDFKDTKNSYSKLSSGLLALDGKSITRVFLSFFGGSTFIYGGAPSERVEWRKQFNLGCDTLHLVLNSPKGIAFEIVGEDFLSHITSRTIKTGVDDIQSGSSGTFHTFKLWELSKFNVDINKKLPWFRISFINPK